MTIIYAEEEGPCRNIPVLITDHADGMLIELRSYGVNGAKNGAVYHYLTMEQAKILRDNLIEWIRKSEELRALRRMVEE